MTASRAKEQLKELDEFEENYDHPYCRCNNRQNSDGSSDESSDEDDQIDVSARGIKRKHE